MPLTGKISLGLPRNWSSWKSKPPSLKQPGSANLYSITMHLSLIATNIPRVHSFLATLQSGQIVVRIGERDHENSWTQSVRQQYSRIIGSRSSAPNDERRNSPLTLVPPSNAVLETRIYSTSPNKEKPHRIESSSDTEKGWPLRNGHDPESSAAPVQSNDGRISIGVEIHRKESNHGSSDKS
jgi:hypothetical protein